jgi:hypothetical protein
MAWRPDEQRNEHPNDGERLTMHSRDSSLGTPKRGAHQVRPNFRSACDNAIALCRAYLDRRIRRCLADVWFRFSEHCLEGAKGPKDLSQIGHRPGPAV